MKSPPSFFAALFFTLSIGWLCSVCQLAGWAVLFIWRSDVGQFWGWLINWGMLSLFGLVVSGRCLPGLPCC